ncbi:MAG: hypothetical protein J3K34DRAFT_447341 [Monoraphidium minutum]|nr:MAG: hypothetical protein J3K34DRAFT_447341 [Monoraphidium minutum]
MGAASPTARPGAAKTLALGGDQHVGFHPQQAAAAQSAVIAAERAQSDSARAALLALINAINGAEPISPPQTAGVESSSTALEEEGAAASAADGAEDPALTVARAADAMSQSADEPLEGLRAYWAERLAAATANWTEASARQARPDAAAAGLEAGLMDRLGEVGSLPLRLAFVDELMQRAAREAPCSIAAQTTWAGDVWALRRELLPWLQYHAALGVSRLYLLYDGTDARVTAALRALPLVEVMVASGPLAQETELSDYGAYLWRHDNNDAWRGRPGNWELLVKQAYGTTRGLNIARQDNVTWLIHIDPDELLNPEGSSAFSLAPELCGAPDHVPAVRFMNVEAVPEAGGIANRFDQVTLFRAHRHMAAPEAQPWRTVFKQGHNEVWLNLYANGKSAVRVDAEGVHQAGPHLFVGTPSSRWATPSNPKGQWRPAVSRSIVLLHYAYTSPGDVAARGSRGCPWPFVEAALQGDLTKVRECFALDLDLRAFLVAVGVDYATAVAATVAPISGDSSTPSASDPGLRAVTTPGATAAAAGGAAAASDLGGNSGVRSQPDVGAAATGNAPARQGVAVTSGSMPVRAAEVDSFFFGELAMTEGAPYACDAPSSNAGGGTQPAWCSMADVARLKQLLLAARLLVRYHGPQQLLRGHEALLQSRMAAAQGAAVGKAVARVHEAASSSGAASRVEGSVTPADGQPEDYGDDFALVGDSKGGGAGAGLSAVEGGSGAAAPAARVDPFDAPERAVTGAAVPAGGMDARAQAEAVRSVPTVETREDIAAGGGVAVPGPEGPSLATADPAVSAFAEFPVAS